MTNKIKEIGSIKSIPFEVPPNYWVLFDLDNTVMESALQLGGDQWFSYMLQHTLPAAQKFVFALYYTLQHYIPVQASEPAIPAMINALQDRGVRVFALTARSQRIHDITQQQLQRIGIDFSRFDHALCSDTHYFSGIICCDGKPKAEGFSLFLDQCTEQPSGVLMFDDKNPHLIGIEALAQQRAFDFLGWRYGFLDEKVAQFDINQANKELNRLKKKLPADTLKSIGILELAAPLDFKKLTADMARFDKKKPPLLTRQDSINRLKSSRTAPEQLAIPLSLQLFGKRFSEQFKNNLFLGESSKLERNDEVATFKHVRQHAKHVYKQGPAYLTPSEHALERTKKAVQHFFQLAYEITSTSQRKFPLAGHNKCLGMVALPQKKLVFIAISQNKDQAKDIALRQEMFSFIEEINARSKSLIFELVSIPTPTQYLMPRTLSNDTQIPASKEQITPHTRCVEVALMVALNKAGRFLTYKPSDLGVLALGGTLWASKVKTNSNAIDGFEGVERNTKYVTKAPIEVQLNQEQSGCIDIWEPCECHCAIYEHEMRAISFAGFRGTSFQEPRTERPIKSHDTSMSFSFSG